MLTVRNLDPDVKAKLRERAAKHGRSMEAEVRAILADAVETPPEQDFVRAIADAFRGLDIPDLPRAQDMPRGIDL